MSAPPARATLFPVGDLAGTLFKTYLAAFYDYVVALLGADGTTAAARNALEIPSYNYLHNPDGAVYQRAVAATADDVYCDDRWYALTQTASITPSQVANPENGFAKALRLTQSQASAQRMGRAQIIESPETYALRGKTVAFAGRLKMSTSATVRYAVLAWTGTADAVTSDVVADWTNSTFSTGNFFNSTTLALVALSSTALSAGTAASFLTTGAVPSGATNLIVVYWTDATAAQNVTLDAWGMRILDATGNVGYIQRSYAEELRLCQRFLPAFNAVSTTDYFANGGIGSTSVGAINFPFTVEPRIAPTGISVSSAAHFAMVQASGASSAATAISFSVAGKKAGRLAVTGTGTPYTAGQAAELYASSASGQILWTGCEL